MTVEQEWFETWFDSPFYHILYKDRCDKEAQYFINNLLNFLKPKQDAMFLDLACGKGRHAIFLNQKGFCVDGVDLSMNSIKCAEMHSNSRLNFFVHDIRKVFKSNNYNFILNLFTSFGYFENEADDLSVINAIALELKDNGILVMDFLNASKTIANLIENEKKIINDIEFNISRSVKNNFIVKTIQFIHEGKDYFFQEKVKALTLNDFNKYFDSSKLKVLHLMGNYDLEKYDKETSDRLIIIAQKS